jgi:two-component system, response regulator RegA
VFLFYLHRKVSKKFYKKPYHSAFKVFFTSCKEKKPLKPLHYKKSDTYTMYMKTTNIDPLQLKISDFEDKTLLIVDDDDPLRGRLSRAMEKKGFSVKEAKTIKEGLNIVKNTPPNFAVVDLRLEDGNGLDVIKELSNVKKDCRIVMLTGYGNLPTAVAAVKAGAIDYIAKPVDADNVESALLASPESKAKPPENPMSADRVKWEHIHRVFELCNRNVSETARRLKMHRRTLQRILSKRSPK